MSDNPEFFQSDDYYISDPTNPFYGLPMGDVPTEPDPNEEVLDEVLYRLGVEDFTGIVVDVDDVKLENLRGNRFANITDAIVYLAEAGILNFGQVTLDEEGEVGLGVDDDSGKAGSE